MRARFILKLVLGVVAAALVAPAANADIIAATQVATPAGDFDIALIDTATGARLGLPSGINTSQDERHPSVTPDHKRLVFERFDASGFAHIIVVDLSTGQQAQIFNAFETGQYDPHSPTITPDGQTVITGADSQSGFGGFPPTFIETSLASFPSGPFPHTVRQEPNLPFGEQGRTEDPTFDPSLGVHGLVAFQFVRFHDPPIHTSLIVDDSGKNETVSEAGHDLALPVISSANHVLLFLRDSDFFYRNLGATGVPGSTSFLLPNAPSVGAVFQSQPAFTADGKYLVFVSPAGDGSPRLVVYDTGTATLLGPGVGLGFLPLHGAISLYEVFVLKGSLITFIGQIPTVQFTLNSGSLVGILVRRIVGHRMLFGHRIPKLRDVGRVPFGAFHRGKHRVRWNLKVNGHKLRPGSYLITPRALTRKGQVRELGKSQVLRIR